MSRKFKWVTEFHRRDCSNCWQSASSRERDGKNPFILTIFINVEWVSGANPRNAEQEIALCPDCLEIADVGPFIGPEVS